MLEKIFDPIFGWAFAIHPAFGIFIVTFVITLIVTLVYKFFTDQHVMKAIKAEVKKLQKDVRKHKDNPEKAMKLQKELMSKNMKVFKMNIKPMLITMLPVLIIFGWLKGVPGLEGKVLWFLNWFWTYLIFTLVLSFLMRRILKVH